MARWNELRSETAPTLCFRRSDHPWRTQLGVVSLLTCSALGSVVAGLSIPSRQSRGHYMRAKDRPTKFLAPSADRDQAAGARKFPISTDRSGNVAVICSSPPIAAISSRSVLTFISGRRNRAQLHKPIIELVRTLDIPAHVPYSIEEILPSLVGGSRAAEMSDCSSSPIARAVNSPTRSAASRT